MNHSLSRLAAGLMLLMAAGGCSAPDAVSGAAKGGKQLAGSVGSFYASVAGSPEEDATNIAGYSMQFKTQYGHWPASLRELTQFVNGKGEQLWPRRLDHLVFHPKDDGRLVIIGEYLEPGYDDSSNSYGSPVRDTAVILITPEGKLRLEIDPDDLKKYE